MREIFSTFVFFCYLVFCAFAPNLVFGLSEFIQIAFVQLVVACAIAYHWYMRIDFSKVYSGSMPKAYLDIDSNQFKYTRYLELGFKTKLPFAAGFLNNEPASKVISDRYDPNLLIISLLGEFAVFMTNIENFKIRHGILGLIFKDVIPAGKNIVAAFGGYIFLWSFSLFVLGLLSKQIYHHQKSLP